MANDLKLQESHPIDENLRPVKVGGEMTAIELSKSKVRTKDLETTNITANNLTVGGVLTSSSLNATDGIYNFRDDGDTDDAFKLTVVGGTGATILETVSAAAPGDGHLSILADGHVEFKTCSAGFDLIAPIWGVADGDGTFTTVCAFNAGNKISCTLDRSLGTNDDINLNFPTTSGNFTLVLLQDGTGSRTIHDNAWNIASTAGSGTLKWSGGSSPTLTTTADKADIVSIFWDADNRIAYAVASLNF